MAVPETTATATDRIERIVELRAPIERVFRAIADADEFGQWFCADFESPFVVGERSWARMTAGGCSDERWFIDIERIEAPHLFVYRWHPHADEPDFDYSSEPMTTVEFRLRPIDTGTELTLVEYGFDQLAGIDRRLAAFRSNSGGWDFQAANIARFIHGE